MRPRLAARQTPCILSRQHATYHPLPLPVSPATAALPRRGGRFFLVCWTIYLIATPLYIFDSGLPQPADALMALTILILATGFALRIPVYHDLYLVGAGFLSWPAGY